MTAWSFCPTQVQHALTKINLKNKGDQNDLNIYRKLWLDQLYDKKQKMYEKPFNFDTQDFLDKNNKIVYVTYNNQDFFGKLKDIPTID